MLVGEATMRRMRDPDYRADQWLHRYDEHVAELNHLVERWAVDRDLHTHHPLCRHTWEG